MYKNPQTQSGSVVVSILVIMMFLTITILSLAVMSQSNIQRSINRIYALQAQYSAESGADTAIAYINQPNATGDASGVYPESGQEKLLVQHTGPSTQDYRATYTAVTAPYLDENGIVDNNKIKVTSTGKVYKPASSSNVSNTYKIEVIVERTTAQITSSLVSRNSVIVDSSVKKITAKSMYVNAFIEVESNVTGLVMDDLTIAGKVSQNGSLCSLIGKGYMEKRPDLVGKAKLNMAGLNCMDTGVGNTSNANFDITANNSELRPITSTHIPWSFKMNTALYANAGSCNDWTAGTSTSTITIPSAGNDKKTHYPNSLSGTASSGSPSCGTAGDIDLGERKIILNDHAHVRGHFCKNNANCRPKFVNPDSANPVFVFVEGTMNFKNITVSKDPASPFYSPGDVVLISYSPAISGITGLNGSKCNGNVATIHLSKDGSNDVLAPKLYLIATVGVICIDQTKFPGADDALGGISGHDLVISSNSGTSFNLSFNPEFPLDSIPIDLSWRAVHIKRLY